VKTENLNELNVSAGMLLKARYIFVLSRGDKSLIA